VAEGYVKLLQIPLQCNIYHHVYIFFANRKKVIESMISSISLETLYHFVSHDSKY